MSDPFDLSDNLSSVGPVKPQPSGHLHLTELNQEQTEAVETVEGAVLVLAGAGTGKTRVLTTRLAHILDSGYAHPGETLTVTFTNKAAREMKSRVEKILKHPLEGWFLGTFHSVAARILRTHAEVVGLKSDFLIFKRANIYIASSFCGFNNRTLFKFISSSSSFSFLLKILAKYK